MNTERTDKMIKIMDELLANKIAAGEVVEKCASIVKELVENSIDALASEIKVELKESGLKEIKVSDNGIGMTKEDAKLSFFRHATSKIQTEDDLYHIETLGFRGEALASIASVSKVNLKTCMNDIGTEVVIEGGKIDIIKACETLKGTIITINDLFYNTPARLKHLKSLYTELANITEFMQKIALAKPNIKMALINDGNVVLKTDGSNNLLKTVSFIFGLETAKKMIEINGQNDDYVIKGYVSEPELHKANRNGLITLVNGRAIRNADLNRAINDGYAGYKPENRYPIVVLNIEVDPYIVDVNVHPAKTEIKFSKLEELLSLVKELIKKALNKEVLIPKVTLPKQNFYQENLDFNIIKEETKPYVKENVNVEINNIKEEVTPKFEKEEIIETAKEEKFPLLYYIGIMHGTYLICQNETGLYLIDQHAAKERINYEYYKENIGISNKRVSMLIPLTLEFSNMESLVLKENLSFLEELGFAIQEFGINTFIVKEHPIWLKKNEETETIKTILDLIILKEKHFDKQKFNDRVAATVACKASIKANENITNEEAIYLIEDLKKCQNPYNCPHGRPTIINFTKEEIEKLFKRTGF